ncbi:hypothetical protein KP509_07G052900 [Ceratopteris richardii]|uniref:Uncharacterized protein n=1 Tax=Ceratopteris richardii TaxID=49495 RepID=A0A8T2UAY1_CERRI|nr:hypothetical protein KP509_07G052900 [Ceratopteris richardii]
MALMKPPSSPRTFVPSTFGRQVLSQRASCPAICFGTADRTTREKQYYSREMDKARIGLEGPGPIYETKVTSIGKQVTAQKESSPQVGFSLARRFITRRYGDGNPGPGTYSSTSAFGPQVLSNQRSPCSADFSRSTRDEQHKIYLSAEFDKEKYGVGSPGPAVCDDSSSMGNQIIAAHKSAPEFRFGAEKRFKHMDNECSPGVGKYEISSSFGKQCDSRRKNLPCFSFTRSSQAQRAKVFISNEHDKVHYGEESPGPGSTFKAYPSMGEMEVDSRKVNSTGSRFGSAPRFRNYHSDIPGPGNYNC